jgi:hypothetical protein
VPFIEVKSFDITSQISASEDSEDEWADQKAVFGVRALVFAEQLAFGNVPQLLACE